MRLSRPDYRAYLGGALADPAGGRERLVEPVEGTQHNGQVDLQQETQVSQGRVGLCHRQRPVEYRQYLGGG